MSYYDHAVAMALQLGLWAAPTRRLRPHEREVEAAREEQAPGPEEQTPSPEEDRKERDLYRRGIA